MMSYADVDYVRELTGISSDLTDAQVQAHLTNAARRVRDLVGSGVYDGAPDSYTAGAL